MLEGGATLGHLRMGCGTVHYAETQGDSLTAEDAEVSPPRLPVAQWRGEGAENWRGRGDGRTAAALIGSADHAFVIWQGLAGIGAKVVAWIDAKCRALSHRSICENCEENHLTRR